MALSGMANTCSQCNRAFPEGEIVKGLCSECRPEAPKLLSPVVIAALVAGAIPFFFHLTSSSSRTENGVVVESFYRDYAAIGGGAIGAAIAVAAVFAALRTAEQKGARIGVACGALVLGLFQLARGFGV